MRTDRIAPALQRLDPERRALLELSFLRGVSDKEIGQLLGVSPGEIHRRREEGVDSLGDVLKLEGVEERGELVRRLGNMPQTAWRGAPGAPSGGPQPDGRRPDGRRTKLWVGLAAGATVAAILVVAEGGHEDHASEPREKSPAPAPTRADRPVRGPRSKMKPIAGARGQGAVQILDVRGRKRLVVSVSGLQPPGGGSYVVWLYRAVDDAEAIGAFKGRSLRLNARLPSDAARYSSLDISLEPRGSEEDHGGDSVLRAPLVHPNPED